MTNLRRILAPYEADPGRLGHATGRETTAFDRERIQADLRACRTSYERWFYVCAGIFLLLLILELTWAVMKRDNPQALRATMTAAGVGLMGTASGMVHLWKMKARTDIIVALLSGLDAAALKAALAVLVPRL